MDCREFRTLFSDYVDDALDPADAFRCREHAAACPACARLDAAYRMGVAALRELDPPTPARDLSVRILHRARREPRLAILAGGYGLAAALLIVTLVGVVAVDLQERRAAEPSAGVRLADSTPVADTQAVGGVDLITVRVREVPAYGPPTTPYVSAAAYDPDPSSRLLIDVPAVWNGR